MLSNCSPNRCYSIVNSIHFWYPIFDIWRPFQLSPQNSTQIESQRTPQRWLPARTARLIAPGAQTESDLIFAVTSRQVWSVLKITPLGQTDVRPSRRWSMPGPFLSRFKPRTTLTDGGPVVAVVISSGDRKITRRHKRRSSSMNCCPRANPFGVRSV